MIAVLAAVAGWAFTNIVVKIADAPGITFTLYRLWLGAGIMAVVLLLTGRRVTWQMARASIPGGLIFGVNVATFISALKLTSVADVLVIQAVQPALILLFAGPLFGERITRHDVTWTLVSVAGVAVVTVGSSGTPAWSLQGDLLAVASLICWTAYFLVSKRARRTVPAVEYMSTVTFVAAIVVTPIALLSGQPLGGLSGRDWMWLALFLVAAQGGHVMVAWAHAQVDVSISSLLILAQPILAGAAAWVILDEPLPPVAIAGGLVVVVAVAAIIGRATRTAGEPIATTETAPP